MDWLFSDELFQNIPDESAMVEDGSAEVLFNREPSYFIGSGDVNFDWLGIIFQHEDACTGKIKYFVVWHARPDKKDKDSVMRGWMDAEDVGNYLIQEWAAAGNPMHDRPSFHSKIIADLRRDVEDQVNEIKRQNASAGKAISFHKLTYLLTKGFHHFFAAVREAKEERDEEGQKLADMFLKFDEEEDCAKVNSGSGLLSPASSFGPCARISPEEF